RTALLNHILLILGILAFFLLVEINTGIFGIADLQAASIHVEFILFVAGLILITLGLSDINFSVRRKITRSSSFTQPTALITRSTLILFLVTLLAFILRLWGLGSAVHHFIDEIHFSTAVMTLLAPDSPVKLLRPFNTVTAFTWIYPYMEAGSVSLLGRPLSGLRLISVIVGTLGVPALYLLVKELFDHKTALLAALLLAVFPPHIQFSRIGLNNIADPLFGTLAL